jgi:peptidoglycan/xylan/chitin deacetylase (PgdA/CDA1 family)
MSDTLVLCYHAVSERWPAAVSLTPDRLERQLAFLVARGYRGATFREAVISPPAARTVAVTFDDGYRSVIERALPILSSLGLPGTVFVPTSFIGTKAPMAWPGIDHWLGSPHEPELTPMSWDDLAALCDAGWEIGSHSRTHPRLTRVDDDTLAEELRRSREECQAGLGRGCHSLAYPFGDHDERVIEFARRAGYRFAATQARWDRRPARLRWPRTGIYHADHFPRFRLKVSPRVRRIRAVRPTSLLPRRRDA